MPYKNIVYVKFHIDLLSDIRFTDKLDDNGKLIYMGLLLLAGRTNNQIPNNPIFIKRNLNLNLTEERISQEISEIRGIYPKLIGNSQYLKFKNFNKIHNYYEKTPKEEKQDRTVVEKKSNKDILDFFSKSHKEVTGVYYPINYGKDQKLIYELLEAYGIDALKTIIIEFFNGAKDNKEWWFDKPISIGMLKHCIPAVINRLRKSNV